MDLLLLTVLAFAPGLFWLWYIYRTDKFRPEPKRLIARTFALGMAAAIPIALVEWAIFSMFPRLDFSPGEVSIVGAFITSFLLVGPIEELGKYLPVRLTVYRSLYFDEPIDGIVYSAAAALGFASVENFFYLSTFGWEVIIVRAPLSTLAHVVFSALWGYALSKSKHSGIGIGLRGTVPRALLGAAFLHGLFDFFILAGTGLSLVIPLMAVATLHFARTIRTAQRESPFRGRFSQVLLKCPGCNVLIRGDARFCTFCGVRLGDFSDTLVFKCSHCGSGVQGYESYCTSCGNKLIRPRKGMD